MGEVGRFCIWVILGSPQGVHFGVAFEAFSEVNLKAILVPQFGFKRDQEGTRKPEAQKKREENNRKGASKNSDAMNL